MKKGIMILSTCILMALVATGGLLLVLSRTALAARMPGDEETTSRAVATTNSALAYPSSGGFTVTPPSLFVTVHPSTTLVRVFTITRETDGAPGAQRMFNGATISRASSPISFASFTPITKMPSAPAW